MKTKNNTRVFIRDRKDYDYAIDRGYSPLFDIRFEMPLELRINIQVELFGKKEPKNDSKFYRYCWNKLGTICEETGRELRAYNACHISHILPKSAYPEMRYEPLNINILSFESHQLWEFGTKDKKSQMNIWEKNQIRIAYLKELYLPLLKKKF
jgi:hypothetical protein